MCTSLFVPVSGIIPTSSAQRNTTCSAVTPSRAAIADRVRSNRPDQP
jgi:hypothetical protein